MVIHATIVIQNFEMKRKYEHSTVNHTKTYRIMVKIILNAKKTGLVEYFIPIKNITLTYKTTVSTYSASKDIIPNLSSKLEQEDFDVYPEAIY
jgi:hypothetical protein